MKIKLLVNLASSEKVYAKSDTIHEVLSTRGGLHTIAINGELLHIPVLLCEIVNPQKI